MKVSRKASDVLACSFSNWYPKFKKVTIDRYLFEIFLLGQ